MRKAIIHALCMVAYVILALPLEEWRFMCILLVFIVCTINWSID